MLCSVSFLLLVVTLGAAVRGGHQALPKTDLTDQQLFWGPDQYEFSIVLRAEGLQCFWHFAHRGETFYLNYMVRPQYLGGLKDLHPARSAEKKTTFCCKGGKY